MDSSDPNAPPSGTFTIQSTVPGSQIPTTFSQQMIAPVGNGAQPAAQQQGGDFTNLAAQQQINSAAQAAAYQAYLNKRLELYEIPMLQTQKDKDAFDAATQAYNDAINQGTLTGSYTPVTAVANTADPAHPTLTYGAPTPTLAAQQAYGYSGGASGTGTPTLATTTLNYGTAMDAMKLLSSLQSDPFAEEAVARGMTASGIPNAIASLVQGKLSPLFQAPQASPIPPSLGNLASTVMPGGQLPAPTVAPNYQMVDVPSGFQESEANTGPVAWNAGQRMYTDGNGYGFVETSTPQGANWVPTGQKTGYAPATFTPLTTAGNNWANQTSAAPASTALPSDATMMQAPNGGLPQRTAMGSPSQAGGSLTNFGAGANVGPAAQAGANSNAALGLAGLVAPNKLNSVAYNQLDGPGQQMVLSAYKQLGYNPDDITAQMKGEQPQFAAPRYGDLTV